MYLPAQLDGVNSVSGFLWLRGSDSPSPNINPTTTPQLPIRQPTAIQRGLYLLLTTIAALQGDGNEPFIP